jgi:enoyl-CoA hydratase/carnithine racemase
MVGLTMTIEPARREAVRFEVADAVATITFARPERHNAWTSEMGEQYFDHLERAAADPGVRAIVVTGAGRSFCPGADMEGLQAAASAGAAQAGTRPQTFPLGVPKPIIAAINGACAGIGLAQALMCDLRFAAAGAKLTTSFARRGLIAEHGTSWLLPRLVGTARALDLLLSARVVLAEEARELGLVNQVVPPEQLLPVALDYARDLARNSSPTSMSVIKRQVLRHLDLPLDEAMAESDALMAQSLRRPDFAEGVASFVERRPPRFEPLSG